MRTNNILCDFLLSRYHIPREWLQESGNLLVLFEETGGDPYQISLEVHYTKTICSRISENYYPPLSAWSRAANGRASVNTVAPELHLQCDDGHVISKITFASYETPSGSCQNFSIGKCHASSTQDLVTEVSWQVSTTSSKNPVSRIYLKLNTSNPRRNESNGDLQGRAGLLKLKTYWLNLFCIK
jgi:hypothetical protein